MIFRLCVYWWVVEYADQRVHGIEDVVTNEGSVISRIVQNYLTFAATKYGGRIGQQG